LNKARYGNKIEKQNSILSAFQSIKTKIKTSINNTITRKTAKSKKNNILKKTDLKLLENMTTLPKMEEEEEEDYEENL